MIKSLGSGINPAFPDPLPARQRYDAGMRTTVLFLLLSLPAFAEELRGKIVAIADGDTCTLLDASKVQHKIRLNGIDAPEKKQAFGTKAREALGEKIHEKEVRIKWTKKDRYGRILGDVYFWDRHINREMIRDGMAWHYRQYSKSVELQREEDAAREAKRGLWADKSPVPPWEFRHPEKVK